MSDQTIQLASARRHRAIRGTLRRTGYWDCHEPVVTVQRAWRTGDGCGASHRIGRYYIWTRETIANDQQSVVPDMRCMPRSRGNWNRRDLSRMRRHWRTMGQRVGGGDEESCETEESSFHACVVPEQLHDQPRDIVLVRQTRRTNQGMCSESVVSAGDACTTRSNQTHDGSSPTPRVPSPNSTARTLRWWIASDAESLRQIANGATSASTLRTCRCRSGASPTICLCEVRAYSKEVLTACRVEQGFKGRKLSTKKSRETYQSQ